MNGTHAWHGTHEQKWAERLESGQSRGRELSRNEEDAQCGLWSLIFNEPSAVQADLQSCTRKQGRKNVCGTALSRCCCCCCICCGPNRRPFHGISLTALLQALSFLPRCPPGMYRRLLSPAASPAGPGRPGPPPAPAGPWARLLWRRTIFPLPRLSQQAAGYVLEGLAAVVPGAACGPGTWQHSPDIVKDVLVDIHGAAKALGRAGRGGAGRGGRRRGHAGSGCQGGRERGCSFTLGSWLTFPSSAEHRCTARPADWAMHGTSSLPLP